MGLRNRVSHRFLSNALSMQNIKTFVFLDLETTGLPAFECNKTRITELSLVAVQSEHLSLGAVPRVQNKLTLCFNPCKIIDSNAERLTGLSNFDLEHLAPFTNDTVGAMNNFLKHNPQPLCLVAHNGNKFDYPILRAELHKTDQKILENVLCIDSLLAFRELHSSDVQETSIPKVKPRSNSPDSWLDDGLDEILCSVLDDLEKQKVIKVQKTNETTPRKSTGPNPSKKPKFDSFTRKLSFSPSFKLVDVYERLTKKKATNMHRAEDDVLMLIMCAATLGDQFIEWANKNAKKLEDIPMMQPGKILGS